VPNVTNVVENHNKSEIGRFMFNVKIKKSENNVNVIINENVWVCCNTNILESVIIVRAGV
jgi:hypothetical protein